MVEPITLNEDVLDSRDVVARIEELAGDRDSWVLGAPDGTETPDPVGWARENPDDACELEQLQDLASQAESSPDWHYGETLINVDYFTDYIEELVNDCYEKPEGFDQCAWPWRHMHMDWEAAAEEAKADYQDVTVGNATYLIRA